MKLKKILFSLAAALCMLALTNAVFPTKAATINNLNPDDKDSLYNAVINANNGDVIDLSGGSFLINDHGSDAAPWPINKAIIIKNGTVNLRRGGIILGADVTFNDVEFIFANPIRNVIAANGYTLTLNNPRISPIAQQAHLFCGGMIAKNNVIGSVSKVSLPNSGPHGKVIINGSNVKLGNIYAGHISTDGTAKTYSIPATISVNTTGSSSIGLSKTDTISGTKYTVKEGIYASGAMETPGPGLTFDTSYVQMPPVPVESLPNAPVVSGKVTINISNSAVPRINGATSSSTYNSEVVFNGGESLVKNITFKDVGSLNIKTGKLEPSASSSLMNTNVTAAEGTRLGLIPLSSNIFTEINNLSGGGTIILGKEQQLFINGNASGSYKIGIGNGAYNNDTSSVSPVENFTYVNATMGSENATFTLLPYLQNNKIVLQHDGKGQWQAVVLTAPEPVKHNITVSASPAEGGKVTSSVASAQKGDTVNITANANSGWRFTGWKVLSGSVSVNKASSASASFTMPDTTVNVQATFEAMPTAPEGAPTGVIVYKSNATGIGIKWNAVKGAAQYEVWRATSTNGAYTKIATVTGTSRVDNNRAVGTRYYYKIRAKNGTSYSPYSAVSNYMLTLAKPTNLTSKSVNAFRLRVDWKAVQGATHYEIWRSYSKTGGFKRIAIIPSANLHRIDSGLQTSLPYYYKVRAKTGNSYSAYSDVVMGRTLVLTTGNINLSKISSTQVRLTWNKTLEASGYEIYRQDGGKGAYRRVGSTTNLNYNTGGLQKGQTYYFRIRAYRLINGERIYGRYSNSKIVKM